MNQSASNPVPGLCSREVLANSKERARNRSLGPRHAEPFPKTEYFSADSRCRSGLVESVFLQLDERFKSDGVVGVPTGVPSLDYAGGPLAGDLVVLAGIPR